MPRQPATKTERIQGDADDLTPIADDDLDALLRSATVDSDHSHQALWRRIQELRALELVDGGKAGKE